MAQALSTFNSLEQSRFEAFRRCTFCGDAISKFIAHCLLHLERQKSWRRQVARDGMGTNGYGVGHNFTSVADEKISAAIKNRRKSKIEPILEDLVVPSSAQEITLVVSTLAKAYAQRTVTQARSMNKSYPSNLPLKREHILQAHLHRVKTGQDPGFFMHPSSQKHHQSGSSLDTDLTYQATLALQEAYENTTKQNKPEKKQHSTEDEIKKNKKKNEKIEHELMTKADDWIDTKLELQEAIDNAEKETNNSKKNLPTEDEIKNDDTENDKDNNNDNNKDDNLMNDADDLIEPTLESQEESDNTVKENKSETKPSTENELTSAVQETSDNATTENEPEKTDPTEDESKNEKKENDDEYSMDDEFMNHADDWMDE